LYKRCRTTLEFVRNLQAVVEARRTATSALTNPRAMFVVVGRECVKRQGPFSNLDWQAEKVGGVGLASYRSVCFSNLVWGRTTATS
jgi:hypothetical protein